MILSIEPETEQNMPAPDEPAVRTLFRQCVVEVAARAKAALPESHGRIDSAVKIVLQGDVELLPNGHDAVVGSQSDGQMVYYDVNGACDCADFPRAPQGQCKHRIAVGLYRRASTMVQQRLDAPPSPQTPAIPSSIPAWALVELHGKQFVTFGGLLAMAHERGLQSLTARFVSVTAELALAEATATFTDGQVFTEAADATPANVNAKIRPHFPRMALTRSKARCLRDALNIALVSVEELDS